MEASMSKRFGSEREGREQYWPGSASYNADKALLEAERILGETEPASDAFPYVFTEGLTRMDALGVVTAHVSLAERISAVLPVLDELAAETYVITREETLQAGVYRNVGIAHTDIYWRNRATLGAMGGAR
jgi:hypothetical protein